MIVRYTLTRRELVGSYFRSLTSSRRFLATILVYSVSLGVFSMAMGGAFSRPLTARDAVVALAWTGGAFLFMPVWLFLRGKKEERTLSISPQGIATEIGSRKGEAPWAKVSLVSNSGRHLLIASATGNAFFLPERAFNDPEQKAEFIRAIDNWRRTR